MNPALSKGTIIDEKYEVIELVGSGGFGSVYKAKQIGFDRIVAIKLLHLATTDDAESIERFRREALAMSSFEHKNIPTVYSFGVWLSEIPYIAMEFLEGKSLRSELSSNKNIEWQRAVSIAQSVCESLRYTHSRGVIHRDLKPENIFLTTNGITEETKVCDFGLARFLPQSKATELETLTATGLLVGSSSYMSPEQCTGKKSDERSDIYSLTCILYEMLTGHPPFESENPVALIHMHVNSPIPQLPELPELNKVIWKGLQKDPANRYQSMNVLAADLAAVKLGQAVKIQTNLNTRSATGTQWLWLGIGVATLTLALCVTLTFQRRLQADNSAITEKISKSSSAIFAQRLSVLAEQQLKDGMDHEATENLEKALSITRKLPKAQTQTEDLLMRLATVYAKEDHEKSISYALQAWEIVKKGSNKRRCVVVLNYIGDAFESSGEREKALKYRRLAVTYAKDEEARLTLQSYLANSLVVYERYDEAKQICKELQAKSEVMDPSAEIRTNFLLAAIYAHEKNRVEARKIETVTIEKAKEFIAAGQNLKDSGYKQTPFDGKQLRDHLVFLAESHLKEGDIKGSFDLVEQFFATVKTYEIGLGHLGRQRLISLSQQYLSLHEPEKAAYIQRQISNEAPATTKTGRLHL